MIVFILYSVFMAHGKMFRCMRTKLSWNDLYNIYSFFRRKIIMSTVCASVFAGYIFSDLVFQCVLVRAKYTTFPHLGPDVNMCLFFTFLIAIIFVHTSNIVNNFG